MPYRTALPFMYAIVGWVALKKGLYWLFGRKPRVNALLFDGMSEHGARIRKYSACWQALDTVYNYRTPKGSTVFHRMVDSFWLNMRNAQAVRNRLKIIKRELRTAILEMNNVYSGHVRILSLAAGTAQGVIEEVAEAKNRGIESEVLLIDHDESALAQALALADKAGIRDSFRTMVGDVKQFKSLTTWFHPHIVEMCGFMDYVSEGCAKSMVCEIGEKLPSGGFFLTCHIHPNMEALFLALVIDWKMRYRTVEDFVRILDTGGFANRRLITEPHGIHSVAVLRK